MAQLIPENVIESVRNQTNIVDVIGQYVQLKKSGKNYLGLCPFHDEKTPSFSVAEDKQIFHCFGCGKGGNVFTFMQEIEGLSFPESVAKVADLSNVNVDFDLSSTKDTSHVSSEKRELISLHERTADLYHHILLNTKIGEKALDYLSKRGLDEQTIKEFKIGFAPMERQVLSKVCQNDHIPDVIMAKSGLFFETNSGDWLDRFYQRIMFPITDERGQTIGFSGRILADDAFDLSDQPKYLNSPETELFNKRHVLYHFSEARQSIRKKSEIVLFEGFMDVIAAWNSGIKNGVASMGTSLTTEQVTMLDRVAEDAVICYDGDNAGVEAGIRAIDLLTSQSALSLQLVSIPYKMDPDDYRQKYGESALKELIQNHRQTILQFKLDYLRQDKDLSNEVDKLNYIESALNEIVKNASIIESDLILSSLSNEFGIAKESLQLDYNNKRKQYRHSNREHYAVETRPAMTMTIPERNKADIVEKAEMLLIYRLLNEKSMLNSFQNQTDFSFFHDCYQELFTHVSSYIRLYGSAPIADILNYLKEDELKQTLVEISMQDFSSESTEQELLDCFAVIQRAKIQEEINQAKEEQCQAMQMGDKNLEFEKTIAIVQLQKQLKNI
ncbi:DNA primase [Vagococcus vulneris]|uniref:DNA primase n=1 Tax=Vagococcus vulneris TaxID=1977869 RepID=A0A430A265_9ENTE|nr:DNA primase [Vagococcus vulneris]RSU00497.1 DNA primase [Vagococcus vulneris]